MLFFHNEVSYVDLVSQSKIQTFFQRGVVCVGVCITLRADSHHLSCHHGCRNVLLGESPNGHY